MLIHEFVAAHRREILQACNNAVRGEPSAEQMDRYANAVFEQVLRFLEARTAHDLHEPAREGNSATPRFELEIVVGASTQMRRTRAAIEQLARRSRAPVLLLGEFGTGKRHCARALHAATFPEGEFFELDVARAAELEQRIWSLRSLASAPAAGGLTVYIPELPALRDRLEDIAELARHFAELSAVRRGSSPILLGQSALSRMRDHAWPGNLAELANLIEQLTENFGPALVEAEDLPQLDERPSGMNFHLPAKGIDFAVLERELLMQALVMAGNNQTRAARLLGLSRDQLRYRLTKFEISANPAQG